MRHQPGNSAGWQQRTGFTLVEMLVSVALVLLMMSLFASIFSMASGSV
ncbi:MAG: prepilin-type N-terminal cleavage/methylation domain-containing protein, partial [Planctomycetaceae bacterium]